MKSVSSVASATLQRVETGSLFFSPSADLPRH